MVCAYTQFIRHRYGDRSSQQFTRCHAFLAEKLEQRVATERVTDSSDWSVREAVAQPAQHEAYVLRLAGVIEARSTIGLTTARTKVQADSSNSVTAKLAVRVDRVAAQ